MTSPTRQTLDVMARIRLRRAWKHEWEQVNPVLRDGEPGFDKTSNLLKIGDGVTPWTGLKYISPSLSDGVSSGDVDVDAAISSHINDSTPHPAYDDGPSFLLLYQNAKV